MRWQLFDGPNVYQLTIETVGETQTGSPEPLSNDDFNAIVALLQSRGVLSATGSLEEVSVQGSVEAYSIPT